VKSNLTSLEWLFSHRFLRGIGEKEREKKDFYLEDY